MAEYGFKKLSSVDTEDSFSSETSKHIIVEDGGSIKRLNASALSPKPFVVTFSGTTEDDNASCDKTFEEIQNAYDNGINISAEYSAYDMKYILQLVGFYDGSTKWFNFSVLWVNSPENFPENGWVAVSCDIGSNGHVQCVINDNT